MRLLNRFWLFVYSTPHIVGSILGLIGLVLYFTGIIRSYWLLIVVGLYLLGYIGYPRNKQYSLKMSDDLQNDQIDYELRALVARIEKKVLPETATKIRSIADLIIDLLPKGKNNPHHRHVLVQTATDYLPSMLEHYLNLPPTFARFHPLQNGKTPRQILMEQLIILEEQLEKISLDIHSGDTEALLAHSRFLHNKFETDKTWVL